MVMENEELEAPPTLEEAEAEFATYQERIRVLTGELKTHDDELVRLNALVKVEEDLYREKNIERMEKLGDLHRLLDLIITMKFGEVAKDGFYGATSRNDLRQRTRPTEDTQQDHRE